MKHTEILSRAPVRIDLAGGTVDIWPLNLLLPHALTLNIGIDLFAETELHFDSGVSAPKIVLKALDQKAELELPWTAIEKDASEIPPALQLHFRFLKHFAPAHTSKGKLTLATRAKSPAGAGLGGSSALSISMIGALRAWAQPDIPVYPEREGEELIKIACDVESQVLGVPAGLQDYYGAMYGGLQSIRWGIGAPSREWLPEKTLYDVADRILLFYSGQSRNSGINNWVLFKKFIDKDADVSKKFHQIADAATHLDDALRAKKWPKVSAAIAEEWDTRRHLASGISTPEIDAAWDAAKKEGAVAFKICGAGGGGCFFVLLPEPNPALAKKIVKKLGALDMRPLEFKAVPRGLTIHTKKK
jgi:D-glycero-alpha-D-manno-heptose-7-phosphate kinase